ncbi:MAG: BON domain-containing protein [Candidatus Binatus sp.]
MNSYKNKMLAVVPAVILGLGLAMPALAQETASSSVPASTSMHQAGQDSEGAVTNTYDGTVTAVDDTRITTEVKTDLATAKDLRSGQIHVTTIAGVVTLDGVVHNSEVVARAEAIARNASGVRGVTNDLRVSSSVPLN